MQDLTDEQPGVDAVLRLGDGAERPGEGQPVGDDLREFGRRRGNQPDALPGVEVQLGQGARAGPDLRGHRLVVDLLAERHDLVDLLAGDERERGVPGGVHVVA